MSRVDIVYIIARKDNLGFLAQMKPAEKPRWVSEPLAAMRFASAEEAIKFASKHFEHDWVYIGEIKIKKKARDNYH